MWYYLKRFLQILGSKVLSRMAPRLIFFQYYNWIGVEAKERKRKFKLHYRPLAEILLMKNMKVKEGKKLGLSTISQQNPNIHEVNALDVNDAQHFFSDKTTISHYERDDDVSSEWDIIDVEVFDAD